MISVEDCMALCDLTPDEVHAICEHEHVPEIIAASMGCYLLHADHGPARIGEMMLDDIRSAVKRGDVAHARALVDVLRHFLQEHPVHARLVRH